MPHRKTHLEQLKEERSRTIERRKRKSREEEGGTRKERYRRLTFVPVLLTVYTIRTMPEVPPTGDSSSDDSSLAIVAMRCSCTIMHYCIFYAIFTGTGTGTDTGTVYLVSDRGHTLRLGLRFSVVFSPKEPRAHD